MRPFRLVHVADCHLDAPSRSLARDVRLRVEQSARAALERAAALAVARDADAFVLAGDLFDRDLIRLATETWLPGVFADVTAAASTVIAITGNHDPGVADGPANRIAWPTTRFHHVCRRRPETIEVRRADGSLAGVVVAAGHETRREAENLVDRFPPSSHPGVPTVGLVHAQVHGYEGDHDRYAPCQVSDLARPGYHYWALGHVHACQRVREDPDAWYAGCLQGRHFGEPGAKGALLVEIAPDGAVDVEFHPLAPVRWETIMIDDLDDVHDTASLLARIEVRFDRLQQSRDALADQDWVLRVVLRGRTPLVHELRGPDAADDLALLVRERLAVLDVEVRDEGLQPPLDLASYRDAPHVLGVALDVIEQARRDDALLNQLAPARLAGAPADPSARHAYLRSLLDDLDLEIASRLIDPDTR